MSKDTHNKRLEFAYDYRGFGALSLFDGKKIVDNLICRTGSIGVDGKLKNAIAVGEWYVPEQSVNTTEPAMSVHKPSDGWKIRLYKKRDNGLYATHFLIHPDGGLGGTLGCVGIQGTNAQGFRFEIDMAVKEMKILPFIISHSQKPGGKNEVAV